jgi:hypothetical protein
MYKWICSREISRRSRSNVEMAVVFRFYNFSRRSEDGTARRRFDSVMARQIVGLADLRLKAQVFLFYTMKGQFCR